MTVWLSVHADAPWGEPAPLSELPACYSCSLSLTLCTLLNIFTLSPRPTKSNGPGDEIPGRRYDKEKNDAPDNTHGEDPVAFGLGRIVSANRPGEESCEGSWEVRVGHLVC